MTPRFSHGSSVGPYTILDCLAVGGMAEVYLALNAGPSGFAKVLALKVVLPHLASEQTFVRMFEDEARIAGLLNHPGVVQVYDFGVDRDVQYMAMEYVDGPSLSRVMARLGPRALIPVPLTLRIAADVCAALEYAHTLRQGGGELLRFVHRDVSLENILVSYAGQTKVGDFGIAKARIAMNVTRAGLRKGKHAYIAPEVLQGKGIDHRLDIYAIGVVLYAMLTGVFPFRRDALARPPPAAPCELNPELPVDLERLVLRALEDDPERRFQSAAELRDELEALMRRTHVGLPHELAAFLAQVFPEGTDPLRAKYRAALDRCTAPPRFGAPHAGPLAATVTDDIAALPTAAMPGGAETAVDDTAGLPSTAMPGGAETAVDNLTAADGIDDTVETSRYEPQRTEAVAQAAPTAREERPLPSLLPHEPERPTRRRWRGLLPLIAMALLFLAAAVTLALILARAR